MELPATMDEPLTTTPMTATLGDGRSLLIRLATAADVAALAAEHPLPESGRAPEALYRSYYRIKTLLYVRGPGAGVVTGWADGQLAGFVFVCRDLSRFSRFARSPRTVLWLIGRLLSGGLGFRLGFVLQALKWGSQHLRRPGDFPSPPEPQEAVPDVAAWIGTVHTTPAFRRLGVASALLPRAETVLHDTGASEVALWVADDNVPAITLYEKLQYRRAARVRRIDETCWLMIKQL
jgi:ribosomal protein S18 acetylase RimI-like enzyme